MTEHEKVAIICAITIIGTALFIAHESCRVKFADVPVWTCVVRK